MRAFDPAAGHRLLAAACRVLGAATHWKTLTTIQTLYSIHYFLDIFTSDCLFRKLGLAEGAAGRRFGKMRRDTTRKYQGVRHIYCDPQRIRDAAQCRNWTIAESSSSFSPHIKRVPAKMDGARLRRTWGWSEPYINRQLSERLPAAATKSAGQARREKGRYFSPQL